LREKGPIYMRATGSRAVAAAGDKATNI